MTATPEFFPSYELLRLAQEYVSEKLGDWPAGFAGHPEPRRRVPTWALFPRWYRWTRILWLDSSSGSRIATIDLNSREIQFSDRVGGDVVGQTHPVPADWDWAIRKGDGVTVAVLLAKRPAGSEIDLRGHHNRAYRGLWVKNEEGTWDQVPGTCEAPHVINMEAEHLGFVLGVTPFLEEVA